MAKKNISPKTLNNKLVVYQAKSGAIELKGDFKKDTMWASLNDIAKLFGRDKSVVSRHLNNIYKSGELNKKSTVAKFATVQYEGKRQVTREMNYYNLDAILSVGYRINSKQATRFRIWATKTLKQHLTEGYTINKQQISKNYQNFLEAVQNVKALLPENDLVETKDVIELINAFASTWFSLEAYDSEKLPSNGYTKQEVTVTAKELQEAINNLKTQLLKKNLATDIFAQENNKNSIEGIIGNVFQVFDGNQVYPTIEEKAAHLLYFMIKNHPFVDGNKRCGAFAFVWFLEKTKNLKANLTPEALTALTLLVAESDPKDKNNIIGLILLLLGKRK